MPEVFGRHSQYQCLRKAESGGPSRRSGSPSHQVHRDSQHDPLRPNLKARSETAHSHLRTDWTHSGTSAVA